MRLCSWLHVHQSRRSSKLQDCIYHDNRGCTCVSSIIMVDVVWAVGPFPDGSSSWRSQERCTHPVPPTQQAQNQWSAPSQLQPALTLRLMSTFAFAATRTIATSSELLIAAQCRAVYPSYTTNTTDTQSVTRPAPSQLQPAPTLLLMSILAFAATRTWATWNESFLAALCRAVNPSCATAIISSVWVCSSSNTQSRSLIFSGAYWSTNLISAIRPSLAALKM